MSRLPSAPPVAQAGALTQQMLDVRVNRSNVQPIEYSQGNPKTQELSVPYPTFLLQFNLTGTYTVVTNPATANPNGRGAINLIKEIRLILDGKDVVFHLPGYLLQYFGELYTKGQLYRSDPTYTAGATSFEYSFVIPVNMGPGYLSLIDPTNWTNIAIEVQWGAPADIATPGAGGHSVSNVKLNCDIMSVAGYPNGVAGGKGAAYSMHVIDYRIVPISSVQPDRHEKLIPGQYYTRICLATLDNGVFSNGILNGVTGKIGASYLQKVDARLLRRQNMWDYSWSADRPGWHVFDFAKHSGSREPQLDQGIGIIGRDSLDLNIVLDVLNPSAGVGDEVIMIFDRLSQPSVLKAVK